MAWIKISDEEARNQPLWEKTCWVGVRFTFLGAVTILFSILLMVSLAVATIKSSSSDFDSEFILKLTITFLWGFTAFYYGFKKEIGTYH